MKLEDHAGRVIDPAAVGDIEPMVATLIESDEAYIILSDYSDNEETYVQAAGTLQEDFIVERRDGCAGEHYRADRRLTAEELIKMLVGYLRGVADWSHVVEWHRVRVDFGAANANA